MMPPGRLGAIVESSSDAILSVTPDGFVTTWNAGAERIFGYTATEMIGRSILRLIPALFHRDKAWLLATVRGAHDIHTYDAVRLTKDGRCIDVSVTLSPLKDAVGQFVGVSKVIRDISERKRGEALLKQAHEALEIKVQERTAELSSANHSLRELSSRLMHVQEEESSRLARDLHDEIGQLLTALKIDLQEIQHGGEAQVRSDSLTDSLELVDRLLTQVRTLALDLRPSLLDDLGLVPALRWYANRQAQRNGWVLSLSVEGIVGRVAVPIEVACFRVVQEALTNVAKYANAKAVDLTLRRHENEVTLVIQDDGVGFDVMLARQRAQGGQSIGLLGMQERVRLAGGALEISSAVGQGTRLELCFPLIEQDQTTPYGSVEVMTS
ncbi:MAG: PAS domain S-box protein [Nitrospira sp.]